MSMSVLNTVYIFVKHNAWIHSDYCNVLVQFVDTIGLNNAKKLEVRVHFCAAPVQISRTHTHVYTHPKHLARVILSIR